MNWRVILLLVVIADFAALTGWAMLEVGYAGIFAAGLSGRRGLNPWPYVVITLLAGSFGPLFYLVRREWGQRSAMPSTA